MHIWWFWINHCKLTSQDEDLLLEGDREVGARTSCVWPIRSLYDKVNQIIMTRSITHRELENMEWSKKVEKKKNVSITPTPNNNPVLCFYFSFLYSIACLFRSYVGMATPTWTSGRGGFNFSRPGRADCAMELCFLCADNLIYGFIVTNLSNRHIVYLALSISHFNSLVWDQGFRWQLLVVQVLILV